MTVTDDRRLTTADYCRNLESYLCQKNGGHLIRIVGPAFEQVCRWAEEGVPLAIARRGIDRYCERRAGKGSSRPRPVRIEFCEADILALFDEWRRAVGVADGSTSEDGAPRKAPLTAHFERTVARLVARRSTASPAFERHVEQLLGKLDRLAAESRKARGHARAAIIDALDSLDRELMTVAAAELDPDAARRARHEAEAELAPFSSRMAPDVRARAIEAACQRLVRESLGLTTIRYG
jgi:hypothetical protein